MDKDIKQFIKSAKNIKLDKEEKYRIRSIIQSHIYNNPVRVGVGLRHREHDWSNQSLINKLASVNIFHLPILAKPMSIILILALMVSGGLSAAAQNSLPNDALYPIKVEVNEQVRSWFAISPEAEAQWQAQLMERRLEETEKVAAEGNLDLATRTKIESNFQDHAEKVQENIAKIESKNNFQAGADISSKLESSLKAHARILSRIAIATENDSQINALAINIQLKADQTSKTRADLENKLVIESETDANAPDLKSAAEGKEKAAKNKIEEVKKFIEKIKESLGAQATTEAEAKIKIADSTMAEGKAKLEAKAYGEAFILFQKAHRIAQEAKLLLEARKDLNVNVQLNSDTESNVDSGDSGQGSIKSNGNLKIKLKM